MRFFSFIEMKQNKIILTEISLCIRTMLIVIYLCDIINLHDQFSSGKTALYHFNISYVTARG